MNRDHNGVAPWRYKEAPRFFRELEAEFEYPIETHTMDAWSYLDELLNTENFCEGRGVKLVDVIVGK